MELVRFWTVYLPFMADSKNTIFGFLVYSLIFFYLFKVRIGVFFLLTMVVFLVVNNFLYYFFLLSLVIYILHYIIFQMVCYLSLLVESSILC